MREERGLIRIEPLSVADFAAIKALADRVSSLIDALVKKAEIGRAGPVRERFKVFAGAAG